MNLIDANVILRYLLNDNAEMAESAKIAIQDGAWTICAVIAEVVYVLAGIYKAPRQDIERFLFTLLCEIEIADKPILISALHHYATTRLDFVDCVLLAYNQDAQTNVITFDKDLQKRLVDR